MISIDIDTLKREYLFASTAAHLYEHFKENISLRNLAKIEKPENLIEEYQERTGKDVRSVEDVVVAYAMLITVTFYDYKETLEIFKKLNLSKLEWSQEIKDIYMREARTTSYITEHGKGIMDDLKQIKSDNSVESFRDISSH
jgi:hypothetical protein